MKRILLVLLAVMSSYFAEAQSPTNKKQSKELVWETNISKAIKMATKSKKPMLLFFTGSDWCGWCIRLQKEVLQTPEFEKWARENVVLVELDFPRRKQQPDEIKNQNNGLQQAFGIQGYPTVWFATAKIQKDGKPNFTGLGSTGYVAGGPTAWLDVANSILKAK